MNDFDLDAKLKSIPLPERTEDYWNNFPAQVRLNLRHAAQRPVAENLWRPRLAWAGGFALAVALAFACVQFHPVKTASLALARQQQNFHTQLARLDAGLHLVMFNPHGMGYLLADAN